MLRLLGAEQPRQRAVARAGQRDQAVGAARERVERDVRVVLDRPAEMRRRDQRAEIVVAGRVLRIERQPVDHRRLAGSAPPQSAGRATASSVPMIGCTPSALAAAE